MKSLLFITLMLLASSCASQYAANSDLKSPAKDIDASIISKKDDYRACYEKEFNQNKNLNGGTVLLKFLIEKNGSVTHTSIADTTINNPNVENCVLKVIQNTKFKPQQDIITIKYPFTFASKTGH